jgi:hypothetical protein
MHSQNRLSPRYINIAITRYYKLARAEAQPSLKKRERKKRETNADTGNQRYKDDPPPLRSPENSHHAPSTSKHRVPSNTFKKENDNEAAAARTSPRVSPSTQRGVGKGYTRCPSGKKAAPTGVTASMSNKPTEISPNPQKTTTPDDP